METNLETKNKAIQKEILRLLPIYKEMYIEHGATYLVEYVYQYVDEIMKNVKKRVTLSCSNSCSFCCHSEIHVSKLEMDYIKLQTKKHAIKGDKKRSKIQNNKSFDKLTFVEKACKFLSSTDGKGHCTIYQIRPLICRTHNSVDEIKLCNKHEFKGVQNKEISTTESEAAMMALFLFSHSVDNEKTDLEVSLKPLHKLMP